MAVPGGLIYWRTNGSPEMLGWSRNLLVTVAAYLFLTMQTNKSVAVAACVQSGDQEDLNYCASQLGEVIDVAPLSQHPAPATEQLSPKTLVSDQRSTVFKRPRQAASGPTSKLRSSDYDLGTDVEVNMIAQLFNNETSPFYPHNQTEFPSQGSEDPLGSGNSPSVASNISVQPTKHRTLNDSGSVLHSYNLTPPKNSTVVALFIFGDSTADAGNNAKLFGSLANAKHKPYGLDFDTHQPTGRFSNGRLSADYLADALGLPLIRPYLELANVNDFLHGINFASAGAGIFDLSGYDLGARITFAQQVHNFMNVVEKLKLTIGSSGTAHLVSHSIFYISIGSNDFLHNYLLNFTAAEINHNSTVEPIETYSSQLVSELSRQIQSMYLVGARKFAVMGIGPLGCTPHYLYAWDSKDGSCILPVNNLVQKFNGDLKEEVVRLNLQLLGARVVFGNVFDILFRITLNPDSYGFLTANTACCGVQKFGGALPCALVTEACADPEDFLWWDEYHPTDKANLFISARIWGGVEEDCFPSNVSHLAEWIL